MNKKVKILLAITVLEMIIAGIIIYIIIGRNLPIEHFAMKTSGSFDGTIKNTKFRITSNDDLNEFCKRYKGFSLPKGYDLFSNTIFIQTKTCGSGSTEVVFDRVNIYNNGVVFDISTNTPSIATMDMAYWYLVAVIPNAKLIGVDVSEWETPTEVYNSLKNEYSIKVDCKKLELKESLNIVKEAVNETGNIILDNYYYSYSKNINAFYLTTYDEGKCNEFIKRINKQSNGMKAEILSVEEKDKTEYYKFKEKLNKDRTPYYFFLLRSEKLYGYNPPYGYEIAQMLEHEKITTNEYGWLQLHFYDFNIDKIESKLDTIIQHKEEWKLYDYDLNIYFYR